MVNANDKPSELERWLDSTVRSSIDLPDLNRRDFVKATGAGALLGAVGSAGAGAQEESDEYYKKTRPTIYTEADRQNALNNIDQFDWASERRDAAVHKADAILEHYSDEDLWRYVTSQEIPRSQGGVPGGFEVAETMDDHVDQGGFIRPIVPPMEWKATDGEYTIPTNDFEAYRQSGRDEEGKFDPDLADDSLLVNEEHPDLPDDWGVDDGTGFTDDLGVLGEEGAEYTPVSWFNHWHVYYGFREILMTLSDAYLFTEDQKYAHAASIMLDRLGDVYAEMEYGNGGGKFINRIWEASRIRDVLRAYDGVFPGQADDDELVSFLDGKADEYPALAPKDTLGAIRENIEEGFVYQILPGVKDYLIRGNFGFHQATLAVSAVLADDPDGYTADAIDFNFQPGTLLGPEESETGEWQVTGGDILGFLVGSPQSGYMVDEQGYPSESAVHYNTSQQSSLEGVAEVLRGYDTYEGADLYGNPKFKQAVDSHWQLTYGKYIPQIANTHGVGNPKAVGGATPKNDRVIQNPDFALTGFDEYGKPELAQWAYMLNGLTTDGLQMGIFHPNPEGIRDEVQAVIDEHGPFPDLASNQQPAYGFTALRDGDVDSPRGVYQYYGRNFWDYSAGLGVGSAHVHMDTHNLGVYGYDLDLSPELGRQGSDWEGNDLDAWVESTPAHNTVTVDEENINHPQWVGFPRHFDHTDRVQLMDVESRYAYEQTDEYRRTTAMVNVDEDTSYVVDFFRVDGGTNHHFSFHAMTSQGIETEGLDLEAQDGGTYESEHVDFAEGGLFSHLYDVKWDDDPADGFSVDWDIEDYWEVRDDGGDPVHLRLTMLNDDIDDVALATSRPAEQDSENNPEELPFVLAHRGREIEVPDPEVEYGDSVGFGEGIDPTNTSAYGGVRVVANADLEGFRVQIDPDTDGISHATIRDTDNNVLADRDVTAVGAGEYVDIPYDGIEAGTTYLVTLGNEGEVYQRNDSTADYPAETDDFTVNAGIYFETSATTSYRYNVTEIQAIHDYEEPEVPEPDPIASTFTSVIEPYEGERVVESAELVPVEGDDSDSARAVKVNLADGRTDYVVSSTNTESMMEIDGQFQFKGAFGVYSLRDGQEEFTYANDATLFRTKGGGRPAIQHNQAAFEGTVDDFTKELTLENQLEVTLANNPRDVNLEDMVGEYIYVDPADPDSIPDGVQEDRRYDNESRDRRNGVIPIEGVETHGDGQATIDIGAYTPIRRYYTNDPADGYSYSIEEGAEFLIPYGTLVE